MLYIMNETFVPMHEVNNM